MTNKEVMQMALNALIDLNEISKNGIALPAEIDTAIEALRTALAQPDPAECDGGQCGIGGYCKQCPKTQSEQEPVAVWELQEDGWDTIADAGWMETLPVGTKLYTAPPQREWVGLTGKEFLEIYDSYEHLDSLMAAVEAKLKEKNNG